MSRDLKSRFSSGALPEVSDVTLVASHSGHEHLDECCSLLRRRSPKQRTSTYKRGSPNAILGEAGEIVLVDRIKRILEDMGLAWTVVRTGLVRHRSTNHSQYQNDDDPWEAIDNSKMGDVHVVDHLGFRYVSFEVKTSLTYDNAAISESELLYSEAEYLCGITKAGLWVCEMDEVRRVAKLKRGPLGDFYVIDFDLVKKVPLESIFLPKSTECREKRKNA